jgi:CxxC-x17-CxxC domain-containing protein
MGRFNNRRDNYTKMYNAMCDECGHACKVPFRPTGDKPVYCSNCFEKHDDGGRRSGAGDFSAICDDCGNECKLPFKPSSDKPVYCSKCFEKRGNGNDRSKGRSNSYSGGGKDYTKKLDYIEDKLDRILEILEQ